MKDPKITIENFTVSNSFETYRNGEKSSHFVSYGVKLDTPATLEEIPLLQLQAAYKVSLAVIQDALIRGAMTVEEANDRISNMQNNHDALRAALEKKISPAKNEEV